MKKVGLKNLPASRWQVKAELADNMPIHRLGVLRTVLPQQIEAIEITANQYLTDERFVPKYQKLNAYEAAANATGELRALFTKPLEKLCKAKANLKKSIEDKVGIVNGYRAREGTGISSVVTREGHET